MNLKFLFFGGLLSIIILFSNFSNVFAYYTNMPASMVIGQTDFGNKTSGGVTASTFANLNLRCLFIDPKGRMIVSDAGNNRVLIWNQVPTNSGLTPANLVLGQPDFISSTANNGGESASSLQDSCGVFSDGNRLFVADGVNARVLLWNNFPNQNGQAADVVIGQTSMTSSTGTCDSVHLQNPTGTYVYNGKLYITDSSHNRLLIWNSVPTQNGQPADVVLGQSDMSTCTSPLSPTQSNMGSPRELMVDSKGRLILADRINHRIMIWNQAPNSTNTPADVLLGQTDFVSKLAPNPPTTSSLNGSIRAVSDGERLFVEDQFNDRILIYNRFPATNGPSADIVIGQPNFTSNSANQGGATAANTLGGPPDVFVYNNKLFVTDEKNLRILVFNNVIATPEVTFDGLENLSDGKLRIKGNVKLGEAGHYDLGGGGGVSFSINGADGVGINTIGQAASDGAGSNYYSFSNDFEPWTGSNGTKDEWLSNFDTTRLNKGFTVKITSRNSNADTSSFFYFEPFKLNFFDKGIVSFSVNKDQTQRIKENVDHFEIMTKKENEDFKIYMNISTNKIAPDGTVVIPVVSPLTSGKYQVKVVSISKNSNLREDSNTISTNIDSKLTPISYINPLNLQVDLNNFPLQVNSISETNIGVISTLNPFTTFKSYTSPTFTPTIIGIAFFGTDVAIKVKDNTSSEFRVYYTKVGSNSIFTKEITLYDSSTIAISVYNFLGHYNQLPPIQISVR